MPAELPVRPLPGEIEEARRTPNGWVYRIDGTWPPEAGVPPHAIVGAWPVGPSGEISGPFVPNPNYQPYLFAGAPPKPGRG